MKSHFHNSQAHLEAVRSVIFDFNLRYVSFPECEVSRSINSSAGALPAGAALRAP